MRSHKSLPKVIKNAYQSVVCPVSVEEEGSPDWAAVRVGVAPVEELGEVVLVVCKGEGAVKAQVYNLKWEIQSLPTMTKRYCKNDTCGLFSTGISGSERKQAQFGSTHASKSQSG